MMSRRSLLPRWRRVTLAVPVLLALAGGAAADEPLVNDASDEAAAVEPDAPTPITKKVLLIIYDPVMSNGQKLHVHRGWPDPYALMPQIYGAISSSSGGYLNYQTVQTIERNEWPLKLDGFRYTESSYLNCLANTSTCHMPDDADYLRVFNDFGICSKLTSGTIDEVVIYGAPYFGFDEFAWKIPADKMPYYTPTNYWIYQGRKKNIPDCGRSVFVMGYSYERGVAEALESFSHRIESALTLTVGRGFWDACPGNATLGPSDWDHFTCIDKDKTSTINVAGCGTAHFPPNGRWDYDDGNTAYVNHACPSWDNYPFTSKTIVNQNCTSWGCSRLSFLQWWMAGLPVIDGLTTNGNLRNWWRYVADYDNAVAAAVIANLQPTTITWPSNLAVQGIAIPFDSGVRNTGFKDSGVFNVRWLVDGADVGAYGGHASVPKNSTVMNGNSAFTRTFTTSGWHTVTFRLDVDGHVAEFNEGDNNTTASIYVNPPRPNLKPTAITYNAAQLRVGQQIFFDSGVTNDGNANSGGFNIKWYVDNVDVGAYGGHAGVNAGQTVLNGNSQFWWTFNTAGTHSVRFTLDVDNYVTEIWETDNSITATFVVTN